MTMAIPSAHLQVPDGWEVTLELRALGPVSEGLTAKMAMKSAPLELRPAVTMTRRIAEPTTAKVMLNAFLKRLELEVPGLQTLDRTPVRFADGVEGDAATVGYELEPGTAVVQLHVYRIDDGVLTHLVATVAEREKSSLGAAIAVVSTFRP